MPPTAVDAFTESLASQSVPVEQLPAAAVTGHLAESIDGPAVGVPPTVDGVALPETVTVDPSASELQAAETGVTGAGPGIADYGSVVVADDGDGSEHVSLFVDTHVAVLAASEVVESMGAALDEIGARTRDGLTSAIVTTGPSATADMGALVTGAHGPSELRVVLVTDR